MAEIIEMPKLSDTMEVGTIANWLKKEGDVVKIGDILCEVETDKATMEMENLALDGVLLKIHIENDSEAPIGSPICTIGEKGEKIPEIKPPNISKKDVEATPATVVAKQESAPTPAQAPAPTQQALTPSSGRIKASPLAKKLAQAKSIDLTLVNGSGPGGRIIKKDVLQAIKSGVSETFNAGNLSKIGEDKTIKLSNMRKTIAQRLVESKSQIPHFYLEIEVDASPLLETRKGLNSYLAELPPEQGGIKLTVNDFILKGCAEALHRVPAVNASWTGNSIQQHGHVHMAFGVAVPDGLVTPVVRDSQAKSLRQISAEAKSLIAKARNKKLTPEEMTGSTFTVTNLGMYGIRAFFGIINPPNAAILSVGATVKKPVVGPNNDIVVGHRMMLALSGDHRVVDGAAGAEFLQTLKSILETPALMMI